MWEYSTSDGVAKVAKITDQFSYTSRFTHLATGGLHDRQLLPKRVHVKPEANFAEWSDKSAHIGAPCCVAVDTEFTRKLARQKTFAEYEQSVGRAVANLWQRRSDSSPWEHAGGEGGDVDAGVPWFPWLLTCLLSQFTWFTCSVLHYSFSFPYGSSTWSTVLIQFYRATVSQNPPPSIAVWFSNQAGHSEATAHHPVRD